MGDLDTQKLRDDDVLMVILSGAGGGVHRRDLRVCLKQVLYEEEHPEEGEVHSLIEGRYFTNRFESAPESESLQNAWTSLVVSGLVDSFVVGGDYMISGDVVSRSEHLRNERRISQGDYDYLRNLGVRSRNKVW